MIRSLSTERNCGGRQSIGLFVVVVLTLMATVMGMGAGVVFADSRMATMNVSAMAEIKVVPDIAMFNIGVDTRAETLEEARRENAKAMEGVRARLIAAGAGEENLRTRGFNVHPEWHYNQKDGSRTLIGYRVSHTLEVIVTDLDVLGTWLDAAMEEGANQISGPTFGLRNSERYEARALEEAVRKARAKADVLARASGVFIKRVVQISEHVNTPYGGNVVARSLMAMDSFAESAPTSISPGEISITASVSMTFEI